MKAVSDDEDRRLYRTSVDEILVLCEGVGAMQLAQKCAQLEKTAPARRIAISVSNAFAPLCANPSQLLQEAYAGLQSPL